MSIIIINTTKVTSTSISAHTRNAIILSEKIGCPIIGTYEECELLDANSFKYFVIVGSAFYPNTAKIERWIRTNSNAKIVWINNECTTSPNSEYARLIKDFYSIIITSVEEKNKVKGYNELHFLNLNALIWKPPIKAVSKKYNCIYYGTYRTGRRVYLQEYLKENLVHLSSSKKNLRRIQQLCGADAIFCDKLSWEKGRETLNNFKYSIYVEDEFSHNVFTNLANRFYECLFCNVVQFFDINCKKTIARSVYNIDEKYYVKDFNELKQKINEFDFKKCIEEQSIWNRMARFEKEKTIAEIKKILK